MKKKKLDFRAMHKLVLVLFYGGITLLAFSYIWSEQNAALSPLCIVLSVLAVGAMLLGLILAFTSINCPHCGKSLTGRGRIPRDLPPFCPHCGEKL